MSDKERLQKIYSNSSSFKRPVRSYFVMMVQPRFSLRLINFAARVIRSYHLDVKDIQKKRKPVKQPVCCMGCGGIIRWYHRAKDSSCGKFHSRCYWVWLNSKIYHAENEVPISVGNKHKEK